MAVRIRHQRLFEAGADVYASSGVTDGRGSFGYMDRGHCQGGSWG